MQLYITEENHSNIDNLLTAVENCVHEIKMWRQYNMFKLKNDKSDFIVLGTRKFVGTFLGPKVGDTIFETGFRIRNIGVIFDQTMSMQ